MEMSPEMMAAFQSSQEGLTASCAGVIKSFNPVKGFGFVTSEDVGGDAYFNSNSLPAELKDGNYDENFLNIVGKTVAFNVHQTPDGKYQARDINLAAVIPEDQLIGTVKSFSDKGMYGFITCPAVNQDIFFKLKFPPQVSGPQGLKGLIVRFCLHLTADGKAQANKVFFKGPSASPPMAPGMHQQMSAAVPMAGKGESSMDSLMGMFQQFMQAKGMGKAGGEGKGPMAFMKGQAGAPQGMGMAMGGAMVGGKGVANGMANGMANGNAVATGVVKNFNLQKGFGFITSPNAPGDVYFKSDVPIDAGTNVSFGLRMTPDGKPQANNVTATLTEGSQVLGSIKSFNALKGFGFITVPGQMADVFFKAQALPPELQNQDSEGVVGAQLHFTIHVTPDGKMQMASATFAGHDGTVKRTASAMNPGGNMGMPAKLQKVEGILSCTVKSYNAMKGWGFLQSPESPGDIYFQKKLLPIEQQQLPLVGSSGSVEIAYTPDGKPQASALELYG
jgi:cold shock CspA family protein